MTNCEVPAGTDAIRGVVTTVPPWAPFTVSVVVPIRVSEPGNPAGKLEVV